MEDRIQEFVNEVHTSLSANSFIKLSLGNYQGTDEGLKNIYIRRAVIKKEDKLSFTYRYKTRDIVRNYNPAEGVATLQQLLPADFHIATLQTTQGSIQFEVLKNGRIVVRKTETEARPAPAPTHDKAKHRLITSQDKPYLQALKITDQHGTVFNNAQDKYRQINHYVDILSTLIRDIPGEGTIRIADMGSGKGYLTFALYDYLTNVLQRNAAVTGVEFRQDLVELCNQIAAETGFEGLHFSQGTIEGFETEKLDMLIALHACDTATDDAIAKGIRAEAELIVVAPCCHKQIRREMEKSKVENDVRFLTRHGIFLERQAEMVTDGIRALILEYFGYRTKVFEFISDAHTPKNVMIVGMKDHHLTVPKQEILDKIKATREYFGIDYHHLEKITGI
ncbi:class I SAM-dependent methyltransferase [Dyadobacter sandarakinus]|nr:SAM-dependent methyltransferase [Dyadobacter sandarakinus]